MNTCQHCGMPSVAGHVCASGGPLKIVYGVVPDPRDAEIAKLSESNQAAYEAGFIEGRKESEGDIWRYQSEIAGNDIEIAALRAELAEARKVLEAVIRNDKTPPYTYNGLASSMNAENTLPATGQRWNTPAEMARAFLARKEAK